MIKINQNLSHEYVSCLSQELELTIMSEVKKELSTMLLSDEEKQEAIENANNSKVCELTDTIEIEFIDTERLFYNQNDGNTYSYSELETIYNSLENDCNKEETFEKFLELALEYGDREVGIVEINL